MKTVSKNHRNVIAYLFLMLGVIAALSFTEYEQQKRESEVKAAFTKIESAKQQRIEQLNFINEQQCNEIENLKKQFRQQAIDKYEDLDETLALLGLQRTKEIEARAKKDRDKVLSALKGQTCPRVRITG